MPYIKQSKRPQFDAEIQRLMDKIESGGDMNYIFTRICHLFVKKFGESYENYSTCVSSLENAKLELYRRKIAPYEDRKIYENGDV